MLRAVINKAQYQRNYETTMLPSHELLHNLVKIRANSTSLSLDLKLHDAIKLASQKREGSRQHVHAPYCTPSTFTIRKSLLILPQLISRKIIEFKGRVWLAGVSGWTG